MCSLSCLRFRVRGHLARAREWVKRVESGHCELIRATEDDVREATAIFFRFDDKRWSFADCISRAVMQRLGIQHAFAFDEHFRQFGTVTVVPEPLS